jgi:quinol monooxygenase YgiN
MIHSTLRMRIPPKKNREVLQVLKPLAERIKVDPGCLGCHLYLDLLEENVLMFEQLWRDEEDLKRHLRSNDYRNVLLAMEMAIAQPEVRFEVVKQTSGFETVESARS